MDGTDVDSYFYHNILDISQSHHRKTPVSKGFNKKFCGFGEFHFQDSKLQQLFILKEGVSISKKKTESLLDSLGEFFKVFDQANKVSQIPSPQPKIEFGFTKAKDELFSHCYKAIVEQLNRQIRISFRFEKNKICVSSVKRFEEYCNQFNLTEVVNLGYREIKHLYKNQLFLLTIVTFFRAITMCSAFTPDCGYYKSTIILIVDVYYPNRKRLGKFCLQRNTFQSLGRSDYQNPQCASVCQVRNILLEEQINSFFLSLSRGVYILEESPKTSQDVFGDVHCLSKYCHNSEKCESNVGYVRISRTIYGSGKFGAWLFVHKVHFMLQEHVRTRKTDKTSSIIVKKRHELGTQQTIVTDCPLSTNQI